jgi:endonuclease-3
VLSQNTHHQNTTRAFGTLSNRFPITPEALSKAAVADIAAAIKVTGLFRNKARVINTIAKIVQGRWGGSLSEIINLPTDAARAQLRALPGAGPKTADVVLLISADKPIVPVDTHVNRVSNRLGLVPAKADYDGVRHGLETLFAPADYYAVHILFIALGRCYC